MLIDFTRHGGRLLLLGPGVLLAASELPAQETNFYSAGVRGGVASSETSFYQCEAFVNRDFRWRGTLGSHWSLQPRMELTSGFLTRYNDYDYVGTFGPSLVIRHSQLPLFVNCGSRVTYLSQSAFGNRDFGIHLQFTSHCGIDWKVVDRWEVGYRFQHMSNGGFGEPNPGLNVHMIGAAYRF